MRSTWLLLKTLRRGLVVVSLLAMFLTFLFGVSDLRLGDPKSHIDTLVLTFLLPVLILPLKLHSRLASLPFPVSPRQIAWVPMMAFGIVWLAGLLGASAAIVYLTLHGYGSLSSLGVFWTRAIDLMPIFVFLLLSTLRLVRVQSQYFFLVFWLPLVFIKGQEQNWFPGLVHSYGSWWPLPALASLFLFFEAPIQISACDRYNLTPSRRFFEYPIKDQHAPMRIRLPKLVCDVLTATAVAVFLVLYLLWPRPVIDISDLMDAQAWVDNPAMWVFAPVVGYSLVAFLGNLCKSTIASGVPPFAAPLVLALRMTGILEPISKAFGIKRGVVSRCRRCSRYKFVWARRCPHCGWQGKGTIVGRQMAKAAKRGNRSVQGLGTRAAYRYSFPVVLLSVGFLFDFQAAIFPFDLVGIHVEQDIAPSARKEAFSEIRTYVKEAAAPDGSPERFRFEIGPSDNGGSLILKGYGLRWASAGEATGALAHDIVQELSDRYALHVSKSFHREEERPRFLSHRFLDNRIHWVE